MKRTNKAFTFSLMAIYTMFLIFIFMVVYFVYDGLKIEGKLDAEFSEIEYIINNDGLSNNSLDIKLNNYVAEGDYLYVEKAIKQYFKDLLAECRRLEDVYNNTQLNTVLYLYNFDSDAPHFENSQKIINDTRTNLEDIKGRLSHYFDINTILSYIDAYELDWYYIDYYKEMMLDEEIINENREEVENSIDNSIIMLNTYTDFFTFLSDNSDYWTMDEDYIYFDTDELLEEYNYYLNLINNMDFTTDIESFV